MQCGLQDDVFTIIPEDDWHNLCQQWDMNPAKGIRAEVDAGNLGSDNNKGSHSLEGEGGAPNFEETNLVEGFNLRKSEVIHISDDDNKNEVAPVLRTTPGVSSPAPRYYGRKNVVI